MTAHDLRPIYAINCPSGGDTWASLDDAHAEIATWPQAAQREAEEAGFIVKWETDWTPCPTEEAS